MTIYKPFLPDQFCVYHTTYSGNLLPQNYIGSSSVDKVLNKNYHGSVASERYADIWKSELKLHPELFSTYIVSYHDTRPNATWKELQVQKTLNVVKSYLFINRAYAKVNGWCDIIYTPEEKAALVKKRCETKIRNGTTHPTPESIQKTKETKIRNGTTNPSSPESIQRGLDTRQRNGTTNPNTPESIQKAKDTRKRNGTTNCSSLRANKFREPQQRKSATTVARRTRMEF